MGPNDGTHNHVTFQVNGVTQKSPAAELYDHGALKVYFPVHCGSMFDCMFGQDGDVLLRINGKPADNMPMQVRFHEAFLRF
jgi:hypothetical protein